MALINYDTLVQHRFVRLHVIPGKYLTSLFYLLLTICMLIQVSIKYEDLSLTLRYIYIFTTCIWGVYSIYETVYFFRNSFNNSISRLKRTNILVTLVLLVFASPMVKLLSVFICIICILKIEKRKYNSDSRFIHYLKYENEKNTQLENILMSFVYIIPAISMYIELPVNTLIFIAAMTIYGMSIFLASVEYNYNQYIKNSPFDEMTLNRELKSYEKMYGKIKVKNEIKKYNTSRNR